MTDDTQDYLDSFDRHRCTLCGNSTESTCLNTVDGHTISTCRDCCDHNHVDPTDHPDDDAAHLDDIEDGVGCGGIWEAITGR